jgi:hypothetical protein
MKRILSTICVAAVYSAALMAQSDSVAGSQTDRKPARGNMRGGTIVVTGCVASGSAEGRYVLNNAMMSDKMTRRKDKTAMKKDEIDKGKPSGGKMMSYILVGGDLKAHVDHTVEVTGTIDRMYEMAAAKKMQRDTRTGMTRDMKAVPLKVMSVKMLSAGCS